MLDNGMTEPLSGCLAELRVARQASASPADAPVVLLAPNARLLPAASDKQRLLDLDSKREARATGDPQMARAIRITS